VTRRRAIAAAAAVVIGLAGVAGVVVAMNRSNVSPGADATSSLPTSRVERGSLELTVHMKGDLRALRQQAIMAPTVGGALRILTMADAGAVVKAGDVILEFDPADQLYAREQALSEVLEAEQEVIKRRADTEAQTAQDRVALLTAESDVRRAELDAKVDQDLIPANEYQIRQAALQEARRVLAQTEQDIKTRATVGAAGLAVLEEKRNKARLAADRAEQNTETLVIKAPMDGVIAVRENRDAAGGIFFSGMSLPAYRVGDTVNPGRPVLDIFDVSRMEIRASVNEQERANLEPKQTVRVHSDVGTGPPLTAAVKAVSGLGKTDWAGPLRVFEVTLEIDRADPRLRPGTSVKVVVPGQRVDNVLILPRQAVFEKDGKPVIYERSGAGFEPRPIKVLHRTESRVAVDGIAEGAEVALINPEATTTGKPSTAAPAGPGLGR
jgi:multidrug resistance efflux pump